VKGERHSNSEELPPKKNPRRAVLRLTGHHDTKSVRTKPHGQKTPDAPLRAGKGREGGGSGNWAPKEGNIQTSSPSWRKWTYFEKRAKGVGWFLGENHFNRWNGDKVFRAQTKKI